MQLYQPTITGSLSISGSIVLEGPITVISGSVSGTASLAVTSSYSQNSERLDNLDSTSFVFTSSYNVDSSSFSTRVTNNESTSSVLTTASASFAVVSQSYSSASGSFSGRVTTIESKYATTGSNIFTSNQTICGNLTTTGTITAQTINVQQVTSSVVYSSGSNIFGNQLSNTQQFTGSMFITGSTLNITGGSVCALNFYASNGTSTASIIRQTDPNSYSSLRLYNDQNSAIRALEIDYFGSTHSSGERAEIFNTGAYPLLLGTSNTARLTISATGAATFTCGITATTLTLNTAAADYAATITNVQDSSQGLLIRSSDNDTTLNILNLQSSVGAVSQTWVDRFTVTKGGNVGINTTSPGSLLSIQRGASGDNIELVGSGASGYSDILFYNTNKVTRLGYIDWSDTQARWNVEANIPFRIYTNSTERITILGGGNVGIGATDPKAKLHTCTGYNSTNLQAIFGNSNGSINCINYDTVVIQQDDVTTLKLVERNIGSIDQVLGISVGDGFARFSTTCTQPMQFFVNGNPSACSYNGLSGILALELASSGISTFSCGLCANRITLAGAVNLCGAIENTGTGTGVYTRSTWYVDTVNSILFENGRTTDSASGTGRTVYFTWRGGPATGGGVQLQHGANAWAAYTSDCKMKTKVADVENGLAAVMKLNPIKFKWTNELETSRTVTGFTAQNVEEAIPDAVFNSWTHCELGEIKSYYQDYLVPYLVKAIQELKCENDIFKSCLGLT